MSVKTPESLIKYCKPNTAELILSSHSLRWSSPEAFEDPFELACAINLGIDGGSLLDSAVKLASSMIFANDPPKGDSPLALAIKRWRDEGRFSTPDEANEVLRDLLKKMVLYRIEQLDETMQKWALYVRNLRICCFCEKPDNMIAWERYADGHKGVALLFKVAQGENGLQPQAVTYQADTAVLTTMREQLTCVLNNKKDSVHTRFKDQFLNKGIHNKSEREWRCIASSKKNIPLTNHAPETWVDDVVFDNRELSAIYLGIKTSEDEKKRLLDLIKEHYKNTKVFQMIKAKGSYALEIEKL